MTERDDEATGAEGTRVEPSTGDENDAPRPSSASPSSDRTDPLSVTVLTWNLAELTPRFVDPGRSRNDEGDSDDGRLAVLSEDDEDGDDEDWESAISSPCARTIASLRRHLSSSSSCDCYDLGDILFLSSQETEIPKPRRTEGRRSRAFRSLCIALAGRGYVPLAIHAMGGLQSLLFVRKEKADRVDYVGVRDVACGVGNLWTNKGAIGIYLTLRHGGRPARRRRPKSNEKEESLRSVLFINAHLAAHVRNVSNRNADYWRIVTELRDDLPPEIARLVRRRRRPLDRRDIATGAPLLEEMDHVFFSGDLNYRLDIGREYAESCVANMPSHGSDEDGEDGEAKNYARRQYLERTLLRHDQLRSAMVRGGPRSPYSDEDDDHDQGGGAFQGLVEAPIAFAPTFKFDKRSIRYDTSKKRRIPAYTDRILYKPSFVELKDDQDNQNIEEGRGASLSLQSLFGGRRPTVWPVEYSSIEECIHSDHRPVFAKFVLDI